GANRYGLVLGRAEVHFDPTVHIFIPDLMFEVPQDKVSPEFPIDPTEQIQIEGGSDSRRIIIAQHHVCDGFHDVSPQEKGVARLQMPAEVLQKMLCRRPFKISDTASEEQDQERLIALAVGRGFLNPFEIRSFQSNHANRPEMSQLLMALE